MVDNTHIYVYGLPMQATSAAPSNLRDRRLALGMTQQALAEAASLSIATIQKLESGRTAGNKSTWRLVNEALRVVDEAVA